MLTAIVGSATVSARPPSRPAGVIDLSVEGLADEPQAAVLAALELSNYQSRPEIGERRLQRLLRQVEGEVDGALAVFGYYQASASTRVESLSGGRYSVIVRVAPGEPVRVTKLDVRIDGAAWRNERIGSLVAGFRPALGEAFDHRTYEASKAAIDRALLRRGYLAQRLVERRVAIDPVANTASVVVHYQSGTRHFLGDVRFSGAQFDDALMQRFVPWRDGMRFDQSRIEDLQHTLAASNDFDDIDIRRGDIDPATLRVPILVTVSPNRRTRYVAGVSYGSDEGAGVRGGIERRWVNRYAHQFFGEAEIAQRRSAVFAEYAWPRFAARVSRYALAARWLDEQWHGIDTRSLLVNGTATARGHHWFAQASLNRLDGSFIVGARQPTTARQQSHAIYPELRYERVLAEDRVRPEQGASLDVRVLGANEAIAGDVSLLQGRATIKRIAPAGLGARLIAQLTLGATRTDDLSALPPELRFFAGGDRSVRGFDYQSLGDRDADGVAIGGRYLATASVEYERDWRDGWSVATFIDAGDVWSSGRPAWAFGVGAGLRWRSPVGPIRIDIAHGFDDPSGGWQLHLSAGPDL